MEYLVSVITKSNRSKSILVNAENCAEVVANIKTKYPNHKVGRISSSEEEIRYFKAMKLWKKNST